MARGCILQFRSLDCSRRLTLGERIARINRLERRNFEIRAQILTMASSPFYSMARVSYLEGESKKAAREIRHLQRCTNKEILENALLRSEISRGIQELKLVEGKNVELEDKINEQEKEIRAQREEIKQDRDQINEQEKEIRAQREEIRAQREEIRAQREEIRQEREERAKQEIRINEQDKEIRFQRAELEDLRTFLQNDYKKLQNEVANLSTQAKVEIKNIPGISTDDQDISSCLIKQVQSSIDLDSVSEDKSQWETCNLSGSIDSSQCTQVVGRFFDRFLKTIRECRILNSIILCRGRR